MADEVKKEYTKRILFIGMPDMAISCFHRLIDNGINIVGVVPPCQDDATFNLMIKTVSPYNVNVITYKNSLSDPDFLEKIKELNADIGVVCSYNKKFPKELLELTKDGFINLHPSPLPEYRGGNPYAHVIINGEKESAITLHYMDESFDTGDIISQYKFPLRDNETMGTLFYRTNDMCANMLYQALDYYENKPFPRKPQDIDGEHKKAPVISFEKRNVFIDWNKSAEEIERFIRGLNPFIGAFSYFKGILIRINSAKIIKKNHNYEPGLIVDFNNTLRIACGKDVLEIGSIQLGAYVISTGDDFVKRVKINKGDKLYSE